MAARKTPRLSEDTRTRIQTTMILKRLMNHINGTLKNEVTGEYTELSASQVTAALGLLKKVLPDLSATNIQGDIFNHHFVVSSEPLSDDEWEDQYAGNVETSERPTESTH